MRVFDYVTRPGSSLQLSCPAFLQLVFLGERFSLLQPRHNNVQEAPQHTMVYKPTINHRMQKQPPRLWKYLQPAIYITKIGLIAALLITPNSIPLISNHYCRKLTPSWNAWTIQNTRFKWLTWVVTLRKVDHAKMYFELVAILRLLAISRPDSSNYDRHRSVYYYRPQCTLWNWWEKKKKNLIDDEICRE